MATSGTLQARLDVLIFQQEAALAVAAALRAANSTAAAPPRCPPASPSKKDVRAILTPCGRSMVDILGQLGFAHLVPGQSTSVPSTRSSSSISAASSSSSSAGTAASSAPSRSSSSTSSSSAKASVRPVATPKPAGVGTGTTPTPLQGFADARAAEAVRLLGEWVELEAGDVLVCQAVCDELDAIYQARAYRLHVLSSTLRIVLPMPSFAEHIGLREDVLEHAQLDSVLEQLADSRSRMVNRSHAFFVSAVATKVNGVSKATASQPASAPCVCPMPPAPPPSPVVPDAKVKGKGKAPTAKPRPPRFRSVASKPSEQAIQDALSDDWVGRIYQAMDAETGDLIICFAVALELRRIFEQRIVRLARTYCALYALDVSLLAKCDCGSDETIVTENQRIDAALGQLGAARKRIYARDVKILHTARVLYLYA